MGNGGNARSIIVAAEDFFLSVVELLLLLPLVLDFWPEDALPLLAAIV